MLGLKIRTSVRLLPAWCLLACLTGSAAEQDKARAAPSSVLAYYDQGGVVVDGVAYFTGSDRRGGFHHVAAFDVKTMRRLRTYPFQQTYDSTPLVYQRRDGTWLVLAHEYKKRRTLAMSRDTAEEVWTSAANQPGAIFFGYSLYLNEDGSRIILAPSANGLHALCGETGRELWWIEQKHAGGVTPCVDQKRGWVFYQCSGKVLKIRAVDGRILRAVDVASPNRCMSWNTVFVDDAHGCFVATRWYGKPVWDSAIRVYDADLNLLWERTGLPIGKKTTITYAEGKLVSSGGNCWTKSYTGDRWKYVIAYSIADGTVIWKLDASKYPFSSIMNVPYYNGYLYAETQNGPHASHILRIDASTGKLVEAYDYGRPITSCAACIIARGRILSGDLHEHRLVVTKIAEGSAADWPGPFGDPQTNQNSAGIEPNAKLVPIEEIPEPAATGL